MGSVSSCARCCTVRPRVAVQGLSECWRTAHEGVGQGAVSGRLAPFAAARCASLARPLAHDVTARECPACVLCGTTDGTP